MKGIFDPYVLWPLDHRHMGTPLPPKTCWRLKWMVPMISLAPYIYGWICLSQIFILLQILWIWFNSVDLGGNITTPNRGRIRTDSNESTDILDTELIPAGIKLYVQVVLKITYLLQKAFLSAYFFFNIHTYNYMSMIFEYRTLPISRFFEKIRLINSYEFSKSIFPVKNHLY